MLTIESWLHPAVHPAGALKPAGLMRKGSSWGASMYTKSAMDFSFFFNAAVLPCKTHIHMSCIPQFVESVYGMRPPYKASQPSSICRPKQASVLKEGPGAVRKFNCSADSLSLSFRKASRHDDLPTTSIQAIDICLKVNNYTSAKYMTQNKKTETHQFSYQLNESPSEKEPHYLQSPREH